FPSFCDHLHLHSFPTRRSSDLAAALDPYMEAEAASFNTEMLSTSFGLTWLISSIGTPSRMIRGLAPASVIVVIPRTRICAVAPGALLFRVTMTPGIDPCNA